MTKAIAIATLFSALAGSAASYAYQGHSAIALGLGVYCALMVIVSTLDGASETIAKAIRRANQFKP